MRGMEGRVRGMEGRMRGMGEGERSGGRVERDRGEGKKDGGKEKRLKGMHRVSQWRDGDEDINKAENEYPATLISTVLDLRLSLI